MDTGVEAGGASVAAEKEGAVHDQFDVTLEDGDLLGEVELTTTLIIAASESDDHLSQEESEGGKEENGQTG